MNQDNSIKYISTATKPVPLNLEVTLTKGLNSVSMPFNDFNFAYLNAIKGKISPILSKVISNLIKSRDFLRIQLDLEFENISTEEYEQLELELLTESDEIDPDLLKNDIELLMKLTNKAFNSEEISTMFNCTIESAEKAINLLLIDEA